MGDRVSVTRMHLEATSFHRFRLQVMEEDQCCLDRRNQPRVINRQCSSISEPRISQLKGIQVQLLLKMDRAQRK